MKKEVFIKYKDLLLFDGVHSASEDDGFFSMVNRHKMIKHLMLKDTVIAPDRWKGTKFKIRYRNFSDETQLALCFGKPYANSSAEEANVTIIAEKSQFSVNVASREFFYTENTSLADGIDIVINENEIMLNEIAVKINAEEFSGYMELFCPKGNLDITDIEVDSESVPYTEEEHREALLKWRHSELDKCDKYLDKLEEYLKQNSNILPEHKGEIILPKRLVDKGEKMSVKILSKTVNAALNITHNCFSDDAVTEPVFLEWKTEGETYFCDVDIEFSIAGNTHIELWSDCCKTVRQVAVLDEGYMAVIPWIGDNKPYLDEELHRFDLPGDYWMPNPQICENPKETVEKFKSYIKNYHKYGDRTACLINGTSILPLSETDSLFELDPVSQERGLKQIERMMKLLGYDSMELVASYTPDALTMSLLEKMGVKALTSLCIWQNWQDGGWKINHCGAPNQPYFPADDDFRRSDDKNGLMCFSMGNSSCNRNYSIMAYDGCPTNVVPGERFFNNLVLNQGIQRFYDTFDGFIADSKNNRGQLLTVTVAIESFRARMDWNATNEMALRYMVKKAANEKIVFTSAADVADYHNEKKLRMQEAYFFQPDYYYGFHNGTMPGRIDDRIEADTHDFLAVIRRGSSLPMYFYDYTEKWESASYEDASRNEFGLVDPDEHKPSECLPKQVYTEDMDVSVQWSENILKLHIKSETTKKRMVTGVFDVPFEKDFEIKFDKDDVKAKKITDIWTGNTHLFFDLGTINEGTTVITAEISGTPRTPINAEDSKEVFAAMWFGKHAYLRSCDKESAISVQINAPDKAYVSLLNGRKIKPENGVLEFTVNTAWFDEAPVLWNYKRDKFQEALKTARIEYKGKTSCIRWSGQ